MTCVVTGTDLAQYPRPALAVDLAILTVVGAGGRDPELRLLVQDRAKPAGRALPGGFVRERRTIAETVEDVLSRKVGATESADIHPRLLQVFDDPERDDRIWAISVAHSVSIPFAKLRGIHGDLVRVTAAGALDGEGSLLFDHDRIVAAAVMSLRDRYEIRRRFVDVHPDPDGFLAEPFTLHQLRRVHEAVLGADLHKDNFSRRMKPYLEMVTDDGDPVLADGLRGRPAVLYRVPRD